MKIDLLKTALNEASAIILKDTRNCRKYFSHNQKWFDLDTSLEVGDEILEKLEFAELSGDTYYDSRTKTAWYYIKDHMAAIEITFKEKKIRVQKKQKYKELIDSVLINSTNAYKVSHNILTGLYSKEKFKKIVKQEIVDLSAEPISMDSGLTSETKDPSTVLVLLAFDIDKFKQVNDTWGHIYGDQVLKAFAMRLERIKNNLASNPAYKKIVLAHVSGEEFFVLINGKLTEDDIRQIAEKFRYEIEHPELPDSSELNKLNSKELQNVVIPQPHDRRITTSIGVAIYSGLSSDNPETVMLSLFHKSDTALYRSKSSGRNLATLSDEILQKCGRVIQYDDKTGIVAIDIGASVGVNNGQEFKVYPPTYNGLTPYIEDDGRSKKTKGIYPKYETARIVVFNAQPDISFALIAKDKSAELSYIPVGSNLEAIPLGHIYDLVENLNVNMVNSVVSNFPSLIGFSEFKDYLKSIAEDEGIAYAIIFRFRNESEFLQKYGSAPLNRSLAEIYSQIKNKFAESNMKIGTIDKTSVCVVGIGTFNNENLLNEIISEFKIGHQELKLICGYYSPEINDEFDEFDEVQSQNNISISPLNAIDLARFTVSSISAYEKNNINMFSIKLAENYLSELRSTKSYDIAISDYKKLKAMGVVSGGLENSIGLCYSAKKDYDNALGHYETAIHIEPNKLVYKSNYAVIANKIDKYELGLAVLNKLNSSELKNLKNIYKFGLINYALLLAKAYKSKSKFFDSERFLKVAEFIKSFSSDEIEKEDLNLIMSIQEKLQIK